MAFPSSPTNGQFTIQNGIAYTLTNNAITLTGTPTIGAVIDIKSTSATNVGVLTGLVFNSFTGDGTTVNFTLSTTPTNKNYTMVSIGGLTQNKNNYSVSGTTLTFTTAPPNTSPIEVVTFGPAINTAQAQGANTQVQYNNNGSLGSSANLTFNSSTNTLASTNLSLTGNATISSNTTVTGTVTANNGVFATNVLHPFFLSAL